MKNLKGKVAVITGAARGLGAASAKALAENGATVVLTDLLVQEGEAMAESLCAEGFKASFYVHDVTDQEAWQAVFDDVIALYGGIDILVNNAGINTLETIETLTLDAFRQLLEVNLLSVFTGTQLAVKTMKNSGGSIINFASSITREVLAVSSAYGPSKAAVANLSKVVAVHCAQQGYNIRVNSVHPGLCDTIMATGNEEIPSDQLAAFVPIGRIGQPREVGEVVAFLASDSASFITGEEIFIDGGMTASMA